MVGAFCRFKISLGVIVTVVKAVTAATVNVVDAVVKSVETIVVVL